MMHKYLLAVWLLFWSFALKLVPMCPVGIRTSIVVSIGSQLRNFISSGANSCLFEAN